MTFRYLSQSRKILRCLCKLKWAFYKKGTIGIHYAERMKRFLHERKGLVKKNAFIFGCILAFLFLNLREESELIIDASYVISVGSINAVHVDTDVINDIVYLKYFKSCGETRSFFWSFIVTEMFYRN